MKRVLNWLGLGVVILLGVCFSIANAGRAVTLELGLFALHDVPVTFVAFGGMVVGMGIVLIAGMKADLRVRQLLRERYMEDRRLAERGDQRKGESLLE